MEISNFLGPVYTWQFLLRFLVRFSSSDACERVQTFRQNFEFKRLIPFEKIKIADISVILERSQKCVIDKIEVKMLGKNQNGTT